MEQSFNWTGKRNYKVLFITGGTGKNGRPYTFITIEDLPREGLKYGEKMKIRVWGEDLSSQIKPNDYIKILGSTDGGWEDKKDEKTGKWYKNYFLICSAGDIVLGEEPFKKDEKKEEQAVMQPIDDDSDFLPF